MDTKQCRKCKLVQSIDNFASHPKRKDNRQSICRNCHSTYSKAHYEKNKRQYIDRAAERKKRHRREWVVFKATLKCVKCGENHPSCLDFHHKDIKSFNISNAVGRLPYEEIMKELEKCEVLCANCHRKLHWPNDIG